MKALIFIVGGLTASWYYTDLGSDHPLHSVVAPLALLLFLIALALWLVLKAGFGANASGSDAGGPDFGGDV